MNPNHAVSKVKTEQADGLVWAADGAAAAAGRDGTAWGAELRDASRGVPLWRGEQGGAAACSGCLGKGICLPLLLLKPTGV